MAYGDILYDYLGKMQVDLSGFNIVRLIRCIRYDLEFATALFVPRDRAFSLSARCHFRVNVVGEPVTDNSLSSRHAFRVHKVTTVDPYRNKGQAQRPSAQDRISCSMSIRRHSGSKSDDDCGIPFMAVAMMKEEPYDIRDIATSATGCCRRETPKLFE